MELVNGYRFLLDWIGTTGVVSAALWISLVTCHYMIQPVSRRACNAAYILWITALYFSIMWLDTLVLLISHFFAAPEWFSCASSYSPPDTISLKGLSPTAEGIFSRPSQALVATSSSHFLVQEPEIFRSGMVKPADPAKLAMMPESLQLLSTNMLTTFIFANVLTGLINIGMDTRGCDSWLARLTILLYITALHILTVHMNAMKTAG